MIKLGVLIVPTMPVDEVIETIHAAEDIGYHYCFVADEGFMPDVYVCLGAGARATSRIRLGPVTNGYTRHPAVTAIAIATLNELSGGRAIATLVAGGLPVLQPMGIARDAPVTVVRETIEIMRRLWSGESISWRGSRYALESAQTRLGRQSNIPIWLAARGSKMLELAGELADAVMLIGKSDLAPALELVEQGAAPSGRRPERIYKDGIAYTPAMKEQAVISHVFAAQEAPARMLRQWGMTEEDARRIRAIYLAEGPQAAAKLIQPEMLARFQIAGTPAECSAMMREVIQEHCLNGFLFNVVAPGLQANVRTMRDVYDIVAAAS